MSRLQARSWQVFFVLVLSSLFGGCFTSAPRYSSSAKPRIGPNSYVVPPNWDYRNYYKIPRDRLKEIVDSYLGTPYRYGGQSPRGMDCSGFVTVVFKRLNQARLPRTARGMYKLGKPVTRARAQAGDLVFFRGGVFNSINHVGIYFENGRFAHASSSNGVIYSNLDQEYYRKHFVGIRRIF